MKEPDGCVDADAKATMAAGVEAVLDSEVSERANLPSGAQNLASRGWSVSMMMIATEFQCHLPQASDAHSIRFMSTLQQHLLLESRDYFYYAKWMPWS